MQRQKSEPDALLTIAVLYGRVSTIEQAEHGISLDTQFSEGRRYAARLAWIIDREFQDILSGMRDDRPGYQAMLEHVRKLRAEGKTVVVVVAALDRFGRKLLERIRARDELKTLGVAVHSVREGGEVSDLVANVLGAVAQEEVRRTGERIHAAREYVRGRGWHTPGHPAWGYLWRPATDVELALGSPLHVLDVDHDAAPYVRELFRLVAGGMSTRSASKWAQAVPPAAHVQVRQRKVQGITETIHVPYGLGHSSVLRVLHNATYTAPPPARWPALVDEATFARVQTFIDSHKAHPHQASERYLLTGYIRCPKCGARVYGRYNHQLGKRAYRCGPDQKGGTHGCGAWSAVAYALEAPVLAQVAALQAPFLALGSSWRAAMRQVWAEMAQPDELASYRTSRVGKLKRDAERARARLLSAATLLVDGTLDRAGYELLRDNAQSELGAIQAELARLDGGVTPKRPDVDALLSVVDSWGGAIVAAPLPAQRAVLAALVVAVDPRRVGKGRFAPVLTWTELGNALFALQTAFTASVGAGLTRW